VTVKEPATEPVHDSVEDPELAVVVNAILFEDNEQVRPVVGETVEERATVPVKPLTPVIVIVEVPAEPTATLTLVGLAATVKSGAKVTRKVTAADWDRDPLAPVTLTVKVPVVDPVHDNVDVAEVVVGVRVTLVGLRAHVRPADGDMVSVNATVPVKPLVAETAIVEVPAVPTVTLTLVGLAVTVKLGAGFTLNVTVAEWDKLPLAPVIVTVKLPVVEPVQERVEAAEVTELVNVTLEGDNAQVRPVEGEMVSERATVPVKPFSAVTVTDEVPAVPTTTVRLVGFAVMLKSAAAVTV
jgi:hypothetical protein